MNPSPPFRLPALARPLIAAVLGLAVLAAPAPPGRAQSGGLPPAAPEGVGRAVVRQAGLEGRVLWLDGTANLQRLSTQAGVAAVLDRCVKANINTIVVDVKPLSGHVLYASKVAPRLKEWRGFQYPADYDLLRTVLDEGHRRGLKVYANINVFSDGHKLVQSGPIYEKKEEQSVIYDVERTLTTPRGDRKTVAMGMNREPEGDQVTVYDAGYRQPLIVPQGQVFALVLQDRVEAVVDGALAPPTGINIPAEGYVLVARGIGAKWMLQGIRVGDTLTWNAADRLQPVVDAPSEVVAAFMNPANPVSREYELKIVDEIVTGYDIDGIVFDRMRYASLHSDFSPLSREKFEAYAGVKLNRWPGDIFSFDPTPARPPVWGPYFKRWLEWRARNIRTWLEDAGKIVRARRPAAKIGVYVGSWYSSYYTVGVNWGSEEFAPGYDWMTPGYSSTGYAGLVDWISTGCYHPVATRAQARSARLDDDYTVQAAAETSVKAIGDSAFVYAGLYVLDYRGSPEAFRQAMQAARDYSQGVMLFDLMHIDEYGWWNILEQEFPTSVRAPHDVPKLLESVRSLRKAVNAAARGTVP